MGHEADELPRVGKPAIAPHFHTVRLMIARSGGDLLGPRCTPPKQFTSYSSAPLRYPIPNVTRRKKVRRSCIKESLSVDSTPVGMYSDWMAGVGWGCYSSINLSSLTP